jgi:hypothetical protein
METTPTGALAKLTPGTAEDVGRRVALDELESPLLREAVAMWDSKRGDRAYPRREDITPRDMSRYLRNVTLYRVIEGGKDFEYRVMGDAAVQAWGHNFVGCGTAELNALQNGMGDIIRRICSSVARRREPLALRGTMAKAGYEHVGQETVFLPLGPDAMVIDHILSVGWYVAKAPVPPRP